MIFDVGEAVVVIVDVLQLLRPQKAETAIVIRLSEGGGIVVPYRGLLHRVIGPILQVLRPQKAETVIVVPDLVRILPPRTGAQSRRTENVLRSFFVRRTTFSVRQDPDKVCRECLLPPAGARMTTTRRQHALSPGAGAQDTHNMQQERRSSYTEQSSFTKTLQLLRPQKAETAIVVRLSEGGGVVVPYRGPTRSRGDQRGPEETNEVPRRQVS